MKSLVHQVRLSNDLEVDIEYEVDEGIIEVTGVFIPNTKKYIDFGDVEESELIDHVIAEMRDFED